MDTPALFVFEGISVDALEGPVLVGVDLAVPNHGITVVVGPSGAGKTTLLRLCNRLEVPARGRVWFRGMNLDDLDPPGLRRRVGMVFQRPTLLPGSVRSNLTLARPDATPLDLSGVLERVELPLRFLDRTVDGLSGGEAQRVCIARALLTSPDALLADEPTAALDPGRRAGIERLARQLADAGMPMLWVTHDVAQARRLADRVVVMDAGSVVAVGAPDDPVVAVHLAEHHDVG